MSLLEEWNSVQCALTSAIDAGRFTGRRDLHRISQAKTGRVRWGRGSDSVCDRLPVQQKTVLVAAAVDVDTHNVALRVDPKRVRKALSARYIDGGKSALGSEFSGAIKKLRGKKVARRIGGPRYQQISSVLKAMVALLVLRSKRSSLC
jgi:hypothetical protein